mgnify:CR=1 FL=1
MDIITTKPELIGLFKQLGLKTGDDVIVHCSLKSLGHLVNGPLDVIEALSYCLDLNEGTILMPAHTGQLTDPAYWKNPSIPDELIETVRSSMNIFNKQLTDVRGRGVLASKFLSYPGVKRSDHPLNSVSALGKRAVMYTSLHDFNEPEGINSPIGTLYKNDGSVIGIGVSVDKFTAIHLAEYLADVDYLYENNPRVLIAKKENNYFFKCIQKYPNDSKNFVKVIPLLKSKGLITELTFKGNTMTHLKLKPATDFIVTILNKNPNFLLEGD